MTLAKWKPFGDLMSLHRGINRLFDDEFRRVWPRNESLESYFPATDVFETKDDYVFKLEVPGMSKDEVKVEFHENMLNISGEKKSSVDVQEDKYHRIESFSGSFNRSYTLPKNANQEKINATMKDGVLEIRVAKAEEKKAKSITIDVK